MVTTPPAEPPLSPLRDRLWAALRLALTAGILAGLIYKLSPGEIARTAGDARPWALVAAALLMAPVQLLVLAKWRWLTRARGIRLSASSLTRIYFQANVVTTVLPTAIGGDVFRIYRVARQSGSGVADVTMTVVFERATGYGAMASLGLIGAAFYFGGVAIGAAAVIALALAAIAAVLIAARVPFNRLPFLAQLRRVVRDRMELQLLVSMTLFSVVIQALFISCAALIGVAFRVDVSWPYWAFAVAVVAAVTLVPVSLGGLGVRESGFAALLSSQNAPATAGASVGFALGLLVTLVSLAVLGALEAAAFARRLRVRSGVALATAGLAPVGEETGAARDG